VPRDGPLELGAPHGEGREEVRERDGRPRLPRRGRLFREAAGAVVGGGGWWVCGDGDGHACAWPPSLPLSACNPPPEHTSTHKNRDTQFHLTQTTED
jgi:hypothetical protein